MCIEINQGICMMIMFVTVFAIAQILEAASDNKFKFNGYNVEVVNTFVSVFTFSIFIMLGTWYLFFT